MYYLLLITDSKVPEEHHTELNVYSEPNANTDYDYVESDSLYQTVVDSNLVDDIKRSPAAKR